MSEQPPQKPVRALSLPNMLTVLRIVVIPAIVILTIADIGLFRWIAFGLFVLAAVTDFLDGFLARILRQTSPLGRMLDPIADKLLVGALIVAFAWDRTLSLFDLIPAIAILMREIFVPGLREYLGAKSIVLHVSWLAKFKTTAQLIAIGVLIVEPLVPDLRLVADAVLWTAAVLTVWTGWTYWQGTWRHMQDDAQ
jgi:CDP-diacylglycerol--glycerol-3-phosphate 3-phosphatidyltransferase